LQDCGQTGPLLAGLLNAPQATFAANIERDDDGSFTVERETDTGEYSCLFQCIFEMCADSHLQRKHLFRLRNFTTKSGTETIKLNASGKPAIITCDLRLNTPRYPTMPNIMKAKKKPVETISLEDMVKDLGLDLDEVLTPKNEVVEVYEPPPRKEGETVGSVDELLSKLREKGLVA